MADYNVPTQNYSEGGYLFDQGNFANSNGNGSGFNVDSLFNFLGTAAQAGFGFGSAYVQSQNGLAPQNNYYAPPAQTQQSVIGAGSNGNLLLWIAGIVLVVLLLLGGIYLLKK